jgi:hypothetical protein
VRPIQPHRKRSTTPLPVENQEAQGGSPFFSNK